MKAHPEAAPAVAAAKAAATTARAPERLTAGQPVKSARFVVAARTCARLTAPFDAPVPAPVAPPEDPFPEPPAAGFDGEAHGSVEGVGLVELVGVATAPGVVDVLDVGDVAPASARRRIVRLGTVPADEPVGDGEAVAVGDDEDAGSSPPVSPHSNVCKEGADPDGAGEADEVACGAGAGASEGLGPEPDAAIATPAGVTASATAADNPILSRFMRRPPARRICPGDRFATRRSAQKTAES